MYLAQDVFVAAIGDRAIVLDLERDKYLGLSKSLTATLLTVTSRSEAEASNDNAAFELARSKLLAAGLVSDHPKEPFESPPAGTRTIWANVARCEWREAVAIMRALSEAALALRFNSFKRTIYWLRALKARSEVSDDERVAQKLVSAFYDTRPWFVLKPICRLDAIALCLFLWRNGVNADLVFGVRLERFGAHCWVQQGEAVLNEAHEGVLKYTPIMVV